MARYLQIIVLAILVSCSDKEHLNNIPVDVQSYVEEFFTEARLHGHPIYLEDTDVNIVFTILEDADGQCALPGGTIKIDSVFWRTASDLNREWLICHELGHCVLGRGHKNERLQRGECASLMRGGTDEASCSTNFISTSWRTYYFDELFEEHMDVPEWYAYVPLMSQSSLQNVVSIDTIIVDDRFSIDFSDEYFQRDHQFCIEFENWNNSEVCIRMNWDDKTAVLCTNDRIELRQRYNIGNYHYLDWYYKFPRPEQTSNPSALCIMRRGDMCYAYIDTVLYHIFDFETVQTARIRSNKIDSVMHIKFYAGVK